MRGSGSSVLIVEDETIVQVHLQRTVEDLGLRVSGAARTADEAIASGRRDRPDVALIDVRLADGSDGIAVGRVLSNELGVPVVYVTAHSDRETLARARETNPAGYLVKPFTAENVKAALSMALPAARDRDATRNPSDRAFHGMIGASRVMEEVFDEIRTVARVDWTVCIEGETGTGKELVARAIHAESPRRAGPFVAVNCAGLSGDLASSHLFGHRKGAFTGAVADHAGVFAAAAGGTLFLDEIGDLPPAVQAFLLRALEEKQVTPLGSSAPRPVDVRLLTATHRDLDADVRRERFREDLLFRIRAARIRVPALRARREDVPGLAAFFARRAATALGVPAPALSDEGIVTLRRHRWPGNVRELESAVNRSVLRDRDGVIGLDDLPVEVVHAGAPEDERERLRRALDAAGGRRARAADLLGVSRATLYRKMAALGLD